MNAEEFHKKMDTDEFELTKNHVTLLRKMFVGWQTCEVGAPEIDPKRPYGDSDVEGNVMELLGWNQDLGCCHEDGAGECEKHGDTFEMVRAEASEIHRETELALQCVLTDGSFEPGLFYKNDSGYWERM